MSPDMAHRINSLLPSNRLAGGTMSKLVTRRHAVALGLATPLAASLAASLAAPLIATRAAAQAPWPSKPVRIIVPFQPGQAADIFARLMAERLTEIWEQQVLVDNKGGGGGIPGTAGGQGGGRRHPGPRGRQGGGARRLHAAGRHQRHLRRQSQPLSRPALQAAGRLQ